MKKLFILLLVILFAACLLPAAAGAENDPAAGPESKTLTVAEGETAYSYEGMTVYCNGGTVYNSLGTVYNNGGTVYCNGGMVYNNTGTVYAAKGTVYNIDGTVYKEDAKVQRVRNGSGRVLRFFELRFADYYAPYVSVEGVTTEPGAERMIIGEDLVCRVRPKSGYVIADASSDAGEITRNPDGSVSLSKVDADTVLTLTIEAQSDSTYNCA